MRAFFLSKDGRVMDGNIRGGGGGGGGGGGVQALPCIYVIYICTPVACTALCNLYIYMLVFLLLCTEVCRLVVTNFAMRIRVCAEFQFKIPTKRERMRRFSSLICDNQPANLCICTFYSICLLLSLAPA